MKGVRTPLQCLLMDLTPVQLHNCGPHCALIPVHVRSRHATRRRPTQTWTQLCVLPSALWHGFRVCPTRPKGNQFHLPLPTGSVTADSGGRHTRRFLHIVFSSHKAVRLVGRVLS